MSVRGVITDCHDGIRYIPEPERLPAETVGFVQEAVVPPLDTKQVWGVVGPSSGMIMTDIFDKPWRLKDVSESSGSDLTHCHLMYYFFYSDVNEIRPQIHG